MDLDGLNVKNETITFLRENKGPGVDKYFLNRTQKALTIKERTDTLNFIKPNNFCLSKDIIKRIKSERRYLQHKYLTEDLEYVQNSKSSIRKRHVS